MYKDSEGKNLSVNVSYLGLLLRMQFDPGLHQNTLQIPLQQNSSICVKPGLPLAIFRELQMLLFFTPALYVAGVTPWQNQVEF